MKNNYALVTGATSGIGLEIARSLANRDYNLILVARREEQLNTVASEIKSDYGVDVEVFSADLANPQAPDDIYAFCNSKNINVEILINNAGYALPNQFHKTPMQDEEDCLRVLGISVIALTKIFLPNMLERRSGKIMIVSSVASFAPPSTIQVLYGPVKTFMNRFSDGLNINYKHKGITSTSVCPGYTVTGFHTASGTQEQMDNVPSFMKLDAKVVAEEGLDAMFKGKRLSIPSIRYKVIVFLMTYASSLLNLFSNQLSGGRYKKN
tara:strand:+ start:254 stop:1051 length:798 start_codon:yes stop_codon:yes gene_type:complete